MADYNPCWPKYQMHCFTKPPQSESETTFAFSSTVAMFMKATTPTRSVADTAAHT